MERSLGGCQYHVMHPGWPQLRNLPGERFRVRKPAARALFRMGHTPGFMAPPQEAPNLEFPFTLDLRR